MATGAKPVRVPEAAIGNATTVNVKRWEEWCELADQSIETIERIAREEVGE